MLVRLDLKSLTDLEGGALGTAFRQAIERCEDDIRDRPALEAARKITLTLTMTPNFDKNRNDVSGVVIKADLDDRLPKRTTAEYVAKLGRAGLHLNELSPDNPDQMTIDQVAPPRAVGDTE